MASDNHSSGCLDDPNFATICSFLEKFGELCHVGPMPFAELQEMLENTTEAPLPLVQLHIRLLRRVFKSINTSKWEKSVSKFAHMYNSQDGWEVERFGYKKSKIQTKLRILKNLLESQFDYNAKFKGEVNKLLASDLRMVPLGRDLEGHAYWYQVDAEANLRVYREDVDDEEWEIVASSREEMEQLISQLKEGKIVRGKNLDDDDNILEEDTNGLESMEIEPQIILDTGKPVDEDEGMDEDSDSLEIAELPDVPDDGDDDSLDQIDTKELALAAEGQQQVIVNGHKSSPLTSNVISASNVNGVDVPSAVSSELPISVKVEEVKPDAAAESAIVLEQCKSENVLSQLPVTEIKPPLSISSIHNSATKPTSKALDPPETKFDAKELLPAATTALHESPYFSSTSNIVKPVSVNDEDLKVKREPELHAEVKLDTVKTVKRIVPKGESSTVSHDSSPYFPSTEGTGYLRDTKAISGQHDQRLPPVSLPVQAPKRSSPVHHSATNVFARKSAPPRVEDIEIARGSTTHLEGTGQSLQQSSDIKLKFPLERLSTFKETLSLGNANVPPDTAGNVIEEASIAPIEVPLSIGTETVTPLETIPDSRNSQCEITATTSVIQSEDSSLTSTAPVLPQENPPIETSTNSAIINAVKHVDPSPVETLPIIDAAVSLPPEKDQASPVQLIQAPLLLEGASSVASSSDPPPGVVEPSIQSSPSSGGVRDSMVQSADISSDHIINKLSKEPATMQDAPLEPHSRSEVVGNTSVTESEPCRAEAEVTVKTPGHQISTNNLTTSDCLGDKVKNSVDNFPSSEAPVASSVETPAHGTACTSETIALTPMEVDKELVAQVQADSQVRAPLHDSQSSVQDIPSEVLSGSVENQKPQSPGKPSESESCVPDTELSSTHGQSLSVQLSDQVSGADPFVSPIEPPAVAEREESSAKMDPNTDNTPIPTTEATPLKADVAEEVLAVEQPDVNAYETQVLPPETSGDTAPEVVPNEPQALSMETTAEVVPAVVPNEPEAVSSQSPRETAPDIPKEPEALPSEIPGESAAVVVTNQVETRPTEAVVEATSSLNQVSDGTPADGVHVVDELTDTAAKENVSVENTVEKSPLPEVPMDEAAVEQPKVEQAPKDEESPKEPSVSDAIEQALPPAPVASEQPPEISSDQLSVKVNETETLPTASVTDVTTESVKVVATESQSETTSISSTEPLVPDSKPKLGLVAYGSSSEDEENEDPPPGLSSKQKVEEDAAGGSGQKRKLEEKGSAREEHEAKVPKITVPENPIVGEAVEEELMIITGAGEGALNQGGNDSPADSPLPPDLEEEEDSDQEQNSEDGLLPSKPKSRGRPRKPRRKEVLKDKNVRERSHTEGKAGSRRSSFNNDDVNGASSGPVRRSGRVAQIRQKEEEERRKLEEERLAQLKEAQVLKQQKQHEKELVKATTPGVVKPKQERTKQPKKVKPLKVSKHVTYLPSPSETESEAEEEEYSGRGKGGKRGRKKKNGKAIRKEPDRWVDRSSSEEEEAAEEEEEEHVEEEEEEELVFKDSDHEFSPESDIGEESEFSPSRHARTAKGKEETVDKYAETYCDKCGKGDHPEWILLCDACDKGWHALCVNPQIWVIPEGEWFCPPCQHNMLVTKLSENLIEYEKILKKRENEVLRKQRLAYVGISLNNVLPSAEKAEKSDTENADDARQQRVKKRGRRLMYSDDEEIGDFINDRDDDDLSGSGSGSYESEEEPMYQLRARRATKGFNFQEYDDMIKSALRDSDEAEEKENGDDEKKPEETPNNGIGEEAEPKAEGEEKEKKEKKGSEGSEEEEDEEKIGGGLKKNRRIKDEDTDEDELDEKEKNRRKMLSQSQKKSRRRLNDLDATSEEDSDDDFKTSEVDDDDEDGDNVVEEDSDWSGGEESDDSIAMARMAKKKRRHHGPLGRQERYTESGTVRRSTRRRKAKVTYDESDQDEDEEDQTEKWQSDEDSEDDPSDSESSDDETWGKKKKKVVPGKSKLPGFFAQADVGSIKKKPKKKRRRVDDDDVDRAWSNQNRGRKTEEPVERKTRGRKINFKDILDSGESDDDGNIRPKRRRILSDSEEDPETDEEAASSRKLAEEIRAENTRKMAEEKVQLEAAAAEKKREAAKAEKQLKNKPPPVLVAPSVLPAQDTSMPVPTTVPSKSVPVTLAQPLIPLSDLPPLNNLELVKERSIKITNSIVESILLRKSPVIPDSPPSPLPIVSISSSIDPSILNLPPLPSLPPNMYLPSVIPSMITAPVLGTGSARVGKKKTAAMLPTPASSADVLPFPSKKSSTTAGLPLPPKPIAPVLTTPSSAANSNISSVLPPNLASDLTRLAGPMYGNSPALRSFHPAWGRNPPPYSSGPPPSVVGKPPPLNSSSFMTQAGSLRSSPPSSYRPPPSISIPNPNALQAFQQFAKRTGEVGSPYRMPPSHQLPGSVLPSISRERDRIFLGGASPYGPYGMLAQGQGQQHSALFVPPPFEYRSPESFKDDLLERVGGQPPPPPPTTSSSSSTSSAAPIPISIAPLSIAPLLSVAVAGPKEEGNNPPGDGEFGGLVSYFSSQHSNDED